MMEIVSQEAINQLQALMDQVEEPLKRTFKIVHQGYLPENLARFLKARGWNVAETHKMLVDCLKWRVQNEIDDILGKPINSADIYKSVRESHLIGLSGHSKEGLPVFAIGVGLSSFDKASVNHYVQSHIQINEYRDRIVLPSASKKYRRPITSCIKILDMTGLKLSALSHIKLMTIIATIDDLNYPEKTHAYYVVNAPYIFSSCWKAVRPLLQERTRNKVQVLAGCGRDELLKIIDHESLPHFCKEEGPGSSRNSKRDNKTENCFSPDHPFHRQLYNYMKQQSSKRKADEGSLHVEFPRPSSEGTKIVQSIKSTFDNRNKLSDSLATITITGV